MTIQWIAILLGVLLCAAVLAIILLCGLLEEAWRKYDRHVERESLNYQRYMRVVSGGSGETQIKGIAAGGNDTDSEQ